MNTNRCHPPLARFPGSRGLLISALGAALLAAVILTSGLDSAAAETVKARRTANVYVKASERSTVVTTVRSGKKMNVLSRKGRWIRVRVNGRTGWIVRTNVKTKQARTTPTRTTRRKAFVKGRSRKRDLRRKSAPKDRLGLDATEDIDDDEDFGDDDDDDFDDGDDDDDDEDFGDDDDDDDDEDFGDDDDEEDDEESDEEGDDDDDDDGDEQKGREFVLAALDVELRSRRSSKADEVAAAGAGDKLYVINREGDWIEVENADGDTGWVKQDSVRKPGHAYKKLAITGNAGLGLVVISQAFRSNANETFANYDIGSRAAAIAIGGSALYDYSKKYLIGGDLDISYAISTPGIRVREGEMAADTGFTQIDGALVGKGGYKLHAKTGTAVFARVGFRYQAFLVKDVNDTMTKNLAALPSEALKGPVLGLEINAARVTDKISANLKLDTMMILASRSQTGGLEDGQTSSATALFATLGVIYDYSPSMRILGGYQYGRASTSWEGRVMTSNRKHTATEASRADVSHVLSVGAVRDF